MTPPHPPANLADLRGVAQSGSAPASGAGGRRFESVHPDHAKSKGQPSKPTGWPFSYMSRRGCWVALLGGTCAISSCTKIQTARSTRGSSPWHETLGGWRIGHSAAPSRSFRISVALWAGLDRSSWPCPLPQFRSPCSFSCSCLPDGPAVASKRSSPICSKRTRCSASNSEDDGFGSPIVSVGGWP